MQGKVEICGVNTSKLQTLSNAEMMRLIERSEQGDMDARSRLVEGNLKLVLSVVQRFLSRGENPDDLFQVGCIGLLKAIANFDTTKNVRFSTSGVPMIAGELRRYLRDYSPIRVSRSLRDTARLSFVVDVEPGEYRLTMKYLVDSLDRNDRVLRSRMWIERHDSTQAYPYTLTLRRHREESFTRTFRVDTSHRRLHLHLLTFTDRSPKRPSVTVSDLRLTHTPETRTAVGSLYIKQLDVRIFADEFFRAALPKDSL